MWIALKGGNANALALTMAVLVAGCGDSPFDPQSAQEQVEERRSGNDVQLQPGLYRMQVSLGGGQDGTTGSQYADDTTCLTNQDVAGGYRETLLAMQGRDACTFTSYELDGERLDAVMVCAGDSVTPQTEASIKGKLTPTATDLTLSMVGFGDGSDAMDMRVTSDRIGDCTD